MHFLEVNLTYALGLGCAVLKWLLMGWLVSASRIWNCTQLALLMGLGTAVVGVGMLFKIEHWAFGDQLLIAGPVIVLVAYVLWYRRKTQRQLLDYLKLAWVVAATAAIEATALFHSLIKPMAGTAEALFWTVALLFIYQRLIRKPQAIPK
jgi:hypothetical protein